MIDRLAPTLFVLLWSTGWIVAKYAVPHADPLTFLSIRYLLSIAAFLTLCLVARAAWPKSLRDAGLAVYSGVFLHGIYLGCIWWAIAEGVPAGISGVIAALQPLLTAAAANRLLGERHSGMQRAGLAIGFVGIAIAISPKLLVLDASNLASAGLPLLVNLIGMVSVTYGTIFQKRHLQSGDIRSIALLQYVGGLLVTLPIALMVENLRFDATQAAVLSMLWSVFGLSMGAIGLLLYLIRRGQVSRAASLIYLVPPAVAVEAAIAFGEPITLPMAIGTVIVVAGVYMINRRPA